MARPNSKERRSRVTATGQHSRRIPEDVWKLYDTEIQQLYVKDHLSLEGMRTHFRDAYGFNPSKKQWKVRLTKLQLKKNLDRGTAARILQLLNDAEVRQIDRRVWFNGQLKTRKDIDTYIAKADNLETADELLQSVPESGLPWPTSIEWADFATGVRAEQSQITRNDPPPVTWSAETISLGADARQDVADATLENPLTASVFNRRSSYVGLSPNLDPPSQSWSGPQHNFEDTMVRRTYGNPNETTRHSDRQTGTSITQDLGPNSFDDVILFEPVSREDAISTVPFFEQLISDSQGGFNDLLNQLDVPHCTPDCAPNPLAAFHGLVSATPFEFELPLGTTLADALRKVLGNYDDVGNPPAEAFLRLCFEGCIYIGQDEPVASQHALSCAVQKFQELIESPAPSLQWGLPVLNRLSFLLETYGQKKMKTMILRKLRNELRPTTEAKCIVFLGTIDFLLDTAAAGWDGQRAEVMVPKLHRIYEVAVEATEKHSALALAARYNLAWALLEAKKYPRALEILVNERAKCESVFGRYAIESISWVATLARTHFRSGDKETAIAMMEEVVLSRAETAYTTHHPVYWEVRYRVGLFLLQSAAVTASQQRTQNAWEKGEELVRESLLWRGAYLGDNNPQTAAANKWLRHYLVEQGKNDEAANLWQWYSSEKAVRYQRI